MDGKSISVRLLSAKTFIQAHYALIYDQDQFTVRLIKQYCESLLLRLE